MLLGNGSILGIDIGSNSIKVVELEELGTGYNLVNIGEAPIDRGSIVNKAIEAPEVVSQTLLKLIQELGTQADDAAISISGDPVLLKRVSLPHMSDSELQKSVKWEFEKLNTGSASDFSYDYDVISTHHKRDMIDVLIVGANKKVTKDYLSILTNVGLNPVLIDIDVFSLESVYEINYPESEGLLALINIGACVTNMLIIDNGESVYARDLPIGGELYTDLIMDNMDISYEEAEELKHNLRSGASDPVVQDLANEFINSITGQIKNALENFSTAHRSENVKRIMLSGGTATLPGLKDSISESINSYVGILNPFRNINFSDSDFDPEYIEDVSAKMNIATGLALRKP